MGAALSAGRQCQWLGEHSRRPRQSPTRSSKEVTAAVLEWRQKTGWGGPKIAKVLERGGVQVASATAQRILKREGLVRPPKTEQTKLRFAAGGM